MKYKRIICEYKELATGNICEQIFRDYSQGDYEELIQEFFDVGMNDVLRKVTLDYACGWREVIDDIEGKNGLYRKMRLVKTGIENFLKGCVC